MNPRRWNRRDPYAPKPHHGDYAARVWLGRAMWTITAALAAAAAWGMV